MNDAPYENDLRERFAALREEESRSEPQFVIPVERGIRRRLSPVWIAAPVAAAVAAFWVAGRDSGVSEVPYSIDLSSTAWVAPTDFLLETPGSDLFVTLPSIGDTPSVPDLGAAEEEITDTAS